MGSYWDFVNAARGYSPGGLIWNMYNYAYDNSHGGQRYALSQAPILGQLRQFTDNIARYQTAYNNNGLDPLYSGSYQQSGFGSALGNVTQKAQKMARALSDTYNLSVDEDVSRTQMKYNYQYQ